jgi:hypothetical protein
VRAPDGASLPIGVGQQAFVPEEPGFYIIETALGTRDVAVNVSPVESVRALETAEAQSGTPDVPFAAREVIHRLWSLFAWAALTLLAVEAVLYIRLDASRRLG